MRFLGVCDPLIEFDDFPGNASAFYRRVSAETLDTAIYLARPSADGQVGFLSCNGNDPQSH